VIDLGAAAEAAKKLSRKMFESSRAVFSLSRSRKISEPSRASHKNFHFNFFHVFAEFSIVSYNNRFNNVNCNSVFPFYLRLLLQQQQPRQNQNQTSNRQPRHLSF